MPATRRRSPTWTAPEPDRAGRAQRLPRRPATDPGRDRRFGNDPGDSAVVQPRPARDTGRAPRHRQWLAAYRRSLSAQRRSGRLTRLSADGLFNHARQWVDWLDVSAGCDAPERTHLRRFLRQLGTTRSAASCRTMADALAHFARWLDCRGVAMEPLLAGLPPAARRADAVRTVADDATVRRLLEGIATERYADRRLRVVVRLLAAGAEPIALHRADRADVDLAGQVLRIQPRGHRQKDGTVAFDRATRLELAGYLRLVPGHGPLLLNANCSGALPRAPRRLSLLSIRLGIQRLLQQAGIVRRDGDGKLLAPGAHGTGFLRRRVFTSLTAETAVEQGLAVNAAQWRAMARRVQGR